MVKTEEASRFRQLALILSIVHHEVILANLLRVFVHFTQSSSSSLKLEHTNKPAASQTDRWIEICENFNVKLEEPA